MKAETPYLEALRYMENAKELLAKAGKKDYRYDDIKYVQIASATAYSGVLIALDEYLKRKEGIKYAKPKSIEDYTSRVAKQNKKLVALLSDVYAALHLAGYYHGTDSTKVIKLGFDEAFAIIEYIKD
jgi:hypothetical protein